MSSIQSGEENSSTPYMIFLYGTRGSGSAVIALKLKQNFSFPDISLAALISNHILEETAHGQQAQEHLLNGKNLSADLALSILSERLSHSDCHRGVLFEDFPLSVNYFQEIKKILAPSFRFLAIYIKASDDWLSERAEHRLICRTCGRVYDEISLPKKNKSLCDICLEPLQRRQNDTPEFIKARAHNYRTQLDPLMEDYQKEKILIEVCGDRSFDSVYEEVLTIIEAHTGIQATKTH